MLARVGRSDNGYSKASSFLGVLMLSACSCFRSYAEMPKSSLRDGRVHRIVHFICAIYKMQSPIRSARRRDLFRLTVEPNFQIFALAGPGGLTPHASPMDHLCSFQNNNACPSAGLTSGACSKIPGDFDLQAARATVGIDVFRSTSTVRWFDCSAGHRTPGRASAGSD